MPVRPTIDSLVAPSNTRVQVSERNNTREQNQDSASEDEDSSGSSNSEDDRLPHRRHTASNSHGRTLSSERPSQQQRTYRSRSPATSTSSRVTEVSIAASDATDPSTVASKHIARRRAEASYPRTYQLFVTQQPSTAAEFRNQVSRIPIAPPLMVQLVVHNSHGEVIPADDELPFLIAGVTLHKANPSEDDENSSASAMIGTTTANPFNLLDLDNNRGVYFVFPDIGIRQQGRWKLNINLMRIASIGASSVMTSGASQPQLTNVWTNPFDVVPVEGYVAPKVTRLTRHFQNQGVRMFVSNSAVIH